MKKLFLFIIPLIILSSCKKEDGDVSVIKINGTSYPTVVIGKQEWTSVNYNGPGGYENNRPTNDENYKKYYTLDDVKNVPLPSGWHIPTRDDVNKLLSNFSSTKDTLGNVVLDFETAANLRSLSGWVVQEAPFNTLGNNTSGFNAFAAGYYTPCLYCENGQTVLAFFLTSTPLPAHMSASPGYYTFIVSSLPLTISADAYTEAYACLSGGSYFNLTAPHSVRFVKNL